MITKTAAACDLLKAMGYVWFPSQGVWIKSAGLPLEELAHVTGWFRRTQKNGKSWDGYTLATRGQAVVHFDLALREINWKAPHGYEICFVAVDIVEDIQGQVDRT
jgi:hypothetical protein